MHSHLDVVERSEADAGGDWALDEVHGDPLVQPSPHALLPEN